MSNIENLPPYQTPEQPTTPPTLGHSGSLEGPMKEQGLPDAPKIVPGMDIPETVYDGFETRPPEDYERGPMDQGKAAVRDSHTLAPEAPRKSKRGLWISLGAGAASLLVAGGAIFGINAAKDGNKTETTPPDPSKTVASALATPGATAPTAPSSEKATELTFEQKVAEHRIKSGQTEQGLSNNIMKEINTWVMSGVDDKTATFKAFAEAGYSSASDTPKYAAAMAKLNAPIFAAALFGDDWATGPNADFVSKMTELNAMYIDYHIATADSGEPFTINDDVTSYELRSGTTTEGNISIETVVNAQIASRNAGYIQVENGLKQVYNTDVKPSPDDPGSVVLSGTFIKNVR